ncbi:HAD family phosphatase [bacterium]|nr:HAD family phosphatase [bacterium]
MAVSAILFDFGGVINNMRWDVARELEEKHGLERSTIVRTLYDNDEWRLAQIGKADPADYREAGHRRLEEAAGTSLPPLHQQWRDSWALIDENLDLIRNLRSGYRLAILSNADKNLVGRLRDGLGIFDLFDTVVCSADVGVAKPDPRIYELTAERLELPPADCVFIDDAEGNVTAAREVGMAAVHYRVHQGDSLPALLADLGVRPGPGA